MTVPTVTATQLSEPGPGKPLLVLGASLGTSVETLWAPTVALLADRAHVVAWDLPGHGRSPAPSEPFTVAELADAVADLIGRVRSESSDAAGAPAAYAGVSIGGATALELGLRHPGLVDGLVVICSAASLGTPEAWRERAETVRTQGTPALVAGSAQRWFSPGFLEREPALGGALLDSLQHTDDTGYAACCEALAQYDVRADLDRISDPVLAVNGADDQVAPPERGEEIVDGVRNGTAVTLPGVAHLAPSEDPTATAAALEDFLADLSSRPTLDEGENA